MVKKSTEHWFQHPSSVPWIHHLLWSLMETDCNIKKSEGVTLSSHFLPFFFPPSSSFPLPFLLFLSSCPPLALRPQTPKIATRHEYYLLLWYPISNATIEVHTSDETKEYHGSFRIWWFSQIHGSCQSWWFSQILLPPKEATLHSYPGCNDVAFNCS